MRSFMRLFVGALTSFSSRDSSISSLERNFQLGVGGDAVDAVPDVTDDDDDDDDVGDANDEDGERDNDEDCRAGSDRDDDQCWLLPFE